MQIERLQYHINTRLGGQQLTRQKMFLYVDLVIDDINALLHSDFPTLDSLGNIVEYNAIPDAYIRSVIVPGAAYKFYCDDDEGLPIAQAFKFEYDDNLYKMLRDYGPLAPKRKDKGGFYDDGSEATCSTNINPDIRYHEVVGPKGDTINKMYVQDGWLYIETNSATTGAKLHQIAQIPSGKDGADGKDGKDGEQGISGVDPDVIEHFSDILAQINGTPAPTSPYYTKEEVDGLLGSSGGSGGVVLHEEIDGKENFTIDIIDNKMVYKGNIIKKFSIDAGDGPSDIPDDENNMSLLFNEMNIMGQNFTNLIFDVIECDNDLWLTIYNSEYSKFFDYPISYMSAMMGETLNKIQIIAGGRFTGAYINMVVEGTYEQ